MPERFGGLLGIAFGLFMLVTRERFTAEILESSRRIWFHRRIGEDILPV